MANGDVESNGQRQRSPFVSSKRERSSSKIDWDGYSKSGNKAVSAWLFCLFVLLGISIQQASLSTVVSQQAVAHSMKEDHSFDSPDLAASNAASRRRTIESLEETLDALVVPSSESAQMESKRNNTEVSEAVGELLAPT